MPSNYTRVNQSSGPLSLRPIRAGEAMLEAAKQAEGGAGSGGVGWRCAGRGSCTGGERGRGRGGRARAGLLPKLPETTSVL